MATATPIAMIAPMNDWRLSVVPVSQSATTTPATTAGVVETTTSASRTDWKLAVSSSRMTTIGHPQADRQPAEHLLHRGDLPADVDGRPLGRLAGPRDRPLDVAGDPAQVLAGDVGRQAHDALHVVAVVLAGHRARADLGDVAEQDLAVAARPLDRDRLDLGRSSS